MPPDRPGVNIMVPVLASGQEEAGCFLRQSFVFQGNATKLPSRAPESWTHQAALWSHSRRLESENAFEGQNQG